MHNDIKRRLLHEVVQDNLARPLVAPPSTPVGRRGWAMVSKMLLVTVAMVLLPVDDLSTVISTIIEPPREVSMSAVIAPLREFPQLAPVTAPLPEVPPQAHESVLEQHVATPEPPPIKAPPPPPEESLPRRERSGALSRRFWHRSP